MGQVVKKVLVALTLILICGTAVVMAQGSFIWGSGIWGSGIWGSDPWAASAGAPAQNVPVMSIEGLAALIVMMALLPLLFKFTRTSGPRR
jgi:hypothetical protein